MRQHRAAMTAAVTAVLCSVVLASAGAAEAGSAVPAGGRVAEQGGTWGTAEEVPGAMALNAGGRAEISSVSCATAGNCGAGGFYTDSSAHQQALAVSETSGTWGSAEEIPGTSALNAGGRAAITSVSCNAAGDCGAGGYYADSSGEQEAFVVSEADGTWGSPEEVPGLAALNLGVSPGATIVSVSCGAVGDCGAGGYYTNSHGRRQAFVVSEADGTWGSAEEVPGTPALNAGGFAEASSVSCASAGNCSAGGYYASSVTDGVPTVQAFVVTRTNGTWGTAREVPGTPALNSGGYAAITSVSCATAANCSAGGLYTNGKPATQAFVVTRTNGTWGTAREVPGIAALNKRLLAQVSSVSCASPGNCSAGGFYADSSFVNQAFVVSQVNGTWGRAEEVPGISALNAISPGATAVSVSCASPGDCGAGGFYTDSSGGNQAYVASQGNGSWDTAEEVPGTPTLNAGGHAATESVSCPPAGNCSAGGYYTNGKSAVEAFVVGETSGS
jgi:hypothetical protein